jgi:hypothetical protein
MPRVVRGSWFGYAPVPVGPFRLLRATLRARIPSVARNAASEMTGKILASFQTGSIVDQS